MYPNIPHLKFPLAVGTRFAAVEEDSPDEISQCVTAVLRTNIGDRIDEPTFGIGDETFLAEPDVAGMMEALDEWEPRAAVTFDVADIVDMGRTIDAQISEEELSGD